MTKSKMTNDEGKEQRNPNSEWSTTQPEQHQPPGRWFEFRHLGILSSFGFRHSSFFNHTVVCDRVWR